MLVGVAWPGGDEVDIFIRTHHEELLDTILTWAEVFRLAAKPPETAEWPLHVMCLEKDLARKAILNQRGYVRTHTWYSYRSHSLGDASSSCLLPQGYSIRPISSVREIPARAEVHRLAFAGSSMNPERYGRIMASPTYRQELDLVATCPDGTFAGFCLAWLDTRNHLAAIEPLGVRPEYRGIGLGRALVQEAMCRARQAGAITAIVVTGGTNVGANKLYEALAFDEKDRGYRWRKTL